MNMFKKKQGAGKGMKSAPQMCNPAGAGSRKEENKISQPGKKKYDSNSMSPVAKEGRRVPYGGETY